ncbi:hypothetical protein QUB18_09315 [Microcoleus sp. B3-D3]
MRRLYSLRVGAEITSLCNHIFLLWTPSGNAASSTVESVIVWPDAERSVRGFATVANGDISTISATSRGGGNAASLRQAVVIVCESACSSEITAGCNVNISSACSAFGVDMGYFDVVAGVEGDFAALFFFGVGVYEPCLNAA